MSDTTSAAFDLRLKMAQIDAALASHDMMRVQAEQLRADADLKRQEFDLAWHKLYLSAVATAAALLGAGAAFATLLKHL